MDGDILTTLLRAFQAEFVLVTARLVPYAGWLLLALVTIEVAWAGAWIAMGSDDNVPGTLFVLGAKTGLYLLIITQWQTWTRALIRGFIWLGLEGTGGVITVTDFTDPSRLAWFGISAMSVVYNRIFSYTGWDALYNWPDILFTGIAATGCLVAFVVFGIQVFVGLLEFYCVGGYIVVLIPFGMVRQTTFLAERALALIWAFALKLGVQATIAGVALPIMQRLQPGLNPSFAMCATLAIAGWAMVVLAWRGPRLAMALFQGSPSLDAHVATQGIRTATHAVQHLVETLRAVAPAPNTPQPQPQPLPQRTRP